MIRRPPRSSLFPSTTLFRSPLTITGSFTASSKVYDGTAAATIATRSLTGVIAPDVVSLTGGTATFSDKNVANGKTVTATGFTLSGADAGNYQLASTTLTATANITPLTITGSFTASSKVYDGTAAATIATRSLTGVIAPDVVSLTGGTATFSDKNVANGKTVTATGFTLSGADAGNYQLASTTLTATANITPLTITGSFTASNKVYDGTAAATIATRWLTGVIAPDVVSLTGGTATFSDKNVANGKTVTATGFTLSGADAGNYQLASTTLTATANITPLTITGSFTASNKVYDGTAAATIATRWPDGVIAPDVVSLTGGTATFSDKNVANGKTVTATGFTLSGADAGNYQLASTTLTATANITPRPLTGSGTAVNKAYDGTTNATVTRPDNRVAGDVLATTYISASFADKNVASGKAVSVSGITISGTDAGNYTVNSTASTTADITPRPLTVTATGGDKE